MTVVVVILLGVGVVLIASAIDCSSIVTTFQKIINNTPVDWTGNAPCSSATPVPGSAGSAGGGGSVAG